MEKDSIESRVGVVITVLAALGAVMMLSLMFAIAIGKAAARADEAHEEQFASMFPAAAAAVQTAPATPYEPRRPASPLPSRTPRSA